MPVLVISYSRVDRPLVRAVVTMLALAMRDIDKAVFYDGDIEPGELWFAKLQAGIDQAAQLFVFWCNHSSASREVRREFTYALERGKRVVPVLLDNTPLADELAPINGIDLRDVVQHSSDTKAPGPTATSAPRRPAWRPLAVSVAFALVGLVIVGSLALHWTSTGPTPLPGPAPSPSRPTAPGPELAARVRLTPVVVTGVLVLLVVLAAAVAALVRRRRRRRFRGSSRRYDAITWETFEYESYLRKLERRKNDVVTAFSAFLRGGD